MSVQRDIYRVVIYVDDCVENPHVYRGTFTELLLSVLMTVLRIHMCTEGHLQSCYYLC